MPSFILRLSRSRSVDICRSLTYATSSAAHWCGAPVSIDTKGKARFCHCAKPKPAIFVSQLFHALYTVRGEWETSSVRSIIPVWREMVFGFTLCFEGQCIIASPGLVSTPEEKIWTFKSILQKTFRSLYLVIYVFVNLKTEVNSSLFR